MKKTTFVLIFLVFISISVLTVQSASADGGGYIVVDYEEHIYLPEQKAAIFWDGTNETMVLSTKIKSDNFSDIAWVIPIQSSSDPTVDVGNTNVFNKIANGFVEYVDTGKSSSSSGELEICISTIIIIMMTALIISFLFVKKRITKIAFILLMLILIPGIFGIGAFYFYYAGLGLGGAADYNVEIIEFKTVDIYDIVTLKADDASQLVGWLNENEFYVNESSIPIIQSYCDQDNFYFIVNRINLTNKYQSESKIQNAISKLKSGIETPLEIKFQPDRPFYPMKMSSINEGNTKINVYFISNFIADDENGYLSYEKRNRESAGLSSYFMGEYDYDYETISMLTYEGNTSNLNGDSYFVERD